MGIGLACAPSGVATKATEENNGIIFVMSIQYPQAIVLEQRLQQLTAEIGDATRKPFRVDMVTSQRQGGVACQCPDKSQITGSLWLVGASPSCEPPYGERNAESDRHRSH